METKAIKYVPVKVKSINDAIKINERLSREQRSSQNKADSLWGCVVHNAIHLGWLSSQAESVKDLQKDISKNISEYLMKNIEIPEVGLDREGKKLQLRKADGSVKFSAWEKTKNIVGYAGDLARIIEAGILDKLMDGEGNVAARCDILALAKIQKSPLDILKNALALAEKAMAKMDKKEKAEAAVLLEAFIIMASK